MQDEFDIDSDQEITIEEFVPGTLYSIAMEEIKRYIPATA